MPSSVCAAGFLLVALVGIGNPKPVRAQEVLSAGIIELFPMGNQGVDGEQSGIFVEIANAISVKSGLRINNAILPFRRAFRAVMSGEMDLFLSFKRQDLDKNLKYLGSVGCAKMLVVARKRIVLGDVKSLSGKRVGFVQGASTGKIYSKKYGMIPVYVPSNGSLFEVLVRKRIDQFMVNSLVYNSYHQGLATHVKLPENWQGDVGQPLPVKVHDIHFSISRKSKFLKHADRLEKAVDDLRSIGRFRQIFQKWGTRDGGDCSGLQDN